MLGTLCHWHLPSWNNDGRHLPGSPKKTWDLGVPNGGKESDEVKTSRLSPPWVEAVLAAKGPPWGLKYTFSSEGTIGYGGKKAEIEELWEELFSDPTEWRDHRSEKPNPRFPDFKHTTHTHKALWLDSKWIPPWVEAKLATKGLEFSCAGAPGYGCKEAEEEKLWQEFFLDPTDWRDHRSDKTDPRFPDFKHKKHPKKALWLKSNWIPPWVHEKLGALPTSSIQLSTFGWNQQLSRCTQVGQYEKTIELFQQMQREGKTANRFTFIPVLRACSSTGLLEQGRRIHTMMQPGFEADLFIGNSLVDMYAKCGSIEEAERVFDKMPTRDVVTWTTLLAGHVKRGSIEEAERLFNQMPTRNVVTFNAMIGGYVKCGEGQKALELFEHMQYQGLEPDPVTFVGVLNACASVAAIEEGRRTHEDIIRRGYESDIVVGTCLVDMYAKCGSIEEAERVFDQMTTRDMATWTAMLTGYVKCGSFKEAERLFKQMPARNVVTVSAMIGGYVKCGEGSKALELFEQMQGQELDPDPVTFVGVLNACASVAAIEEGKCVHDEIIRRGHESYDVVGNCLIDMYSKCGSIEEAERVFDKMPTRDVVTWTTMLSGYVKCGSIEEAERLFNQMPTRNVVTFNAMIGGYVKFGEGQKALELFEQMQGQGLDPDPVTFVGVLNACASLAAIEGGRHAHAEIIHRGYELDIIVGNCLVDMYAKCGSIQEAERVFDQMPTRDVVTFNAMLAGYVKHGSIEASERLFNQMPTRDVVTFSTMISGYVKCGFSQKALELFEQMQGQGVDPDHVTFVGVLNACSSIAAIEGGRRVHDEIIFRGYESDIVVGTCLVNMYAKCGSIEEAEMVFNQMPMRDVTTWNAILAGYGIHGYARRALETFSNMCKVIEVNSVTFLSLLSACSHGGLVADGVGYFESMSTVYNISPTVEHFACVVDLLGRAGHFGEAEDLIISMPMDPNVCVWMALLGASRVHANVEVGERCAKRVLELDPENAAAYVLLSDIYVTAGQVQ